MGKGGGTGHRRNPEFSPPTIKGSRGRRGWDEGGLDFKIIATDIAGSACIIEAEGPPPPQFPFRVWKRPGQRKGGEVWELRPFPKSQTRETEGTEASPCHTHTRGNLGLGEMRTPFISGGT